MSDNQSWFELVQYSFAGGDHSSGVVAYSQDIDKLKWYAEQRARKPLEWSTDNHVKVDVYGGYDIKPLDPKKDVVILI